MNNAILESLEDLPMLNNTLVEIQKIQDNFDIGVSDIVKIIEKDPMEATNILKMVNSPLYNASEKEITNLKQAITLFGITKTFGILLNSHISNLLSVDMSPYNTTAEDFAKLSVLQSALVKKIFEKHDKKEQDLAFLSALVQEVGKVIISNIIIEEGELEDFSEDIEETNNIEEIEYSYIGTNTNIITTNILKKWGIDKTIIDILLGSTAPEKAPKELKEICATLNIVRTAIPINDPLGEEKVEYALKKAKRYGLNVENIIKSIEFIKQKV